MYERHGSWGGYCALFDTACEEDVDGHAAGQETCPMMTTNMGANFSYYNDVYNKIPASSNPEPQSSESTASSSQNDLYNSMTKTHLGWEKKSSGHFLEAC
jgi:hypothetical protein